MAIAAARAGVSQSDAGPVVDLVRRFRDERTGRHRPSLRAAIMIARVIVQRGATFDPSDPVFRRTFRDVLGLDRLGVRDDAELRSNEIMSEDLNDACQLVDVCNPGIQLIHCARSKRNKEALT